MEECKESLKVVRYPANFYKHEYFDGGVTVVKDLDELLDDMCKRANKRLLETKPITPIMYPKNDI